MINDEWFQHIVRHGPGDYGVVKKDIFAKTYDKSKEGK